MNEKEVDKIIDQIFRSENLEVVREALIQYEPKKDYKEAYHILMEYWDSLPDEEKPNIDKELKKVGL